MKISAVNLYSNNNYIKNINTSFSSQVQSKQNSENINDNVSKGLSVAKKMMKMARINNLSLQNIETLLNEGSPVPVNVQSIKNSPSPIQQFSASKVLAHMLPMYDYNLQLSRANIYIADDASTAKEQGELIANTAHEYTHVLQRNNDKNYYGISKYTDSPREIIQIARTAQAVMQNTIRDCSSQICTSPMQTSKILNATLQNKYNPKENIKKTIMHDLIDSASSMLSQQMRKDKNDMKEAVAGWIKQETANEVEAYGVTIKSLEAWGKYNPEYKAKMMLSRNIHQYINEQL